MASTFLHRRPTTTLRKILSLPNPIHNHRHSNLSPPIHHRSICSQPQPHPLLKPGFTPFDVKRALNSHKSDPDAALVVFNWASQQPNYTHDPSTYLTVFKICVARREFKQARSIIEQLISGKNPPPFPLTLPFYNLLIKFCCSHWALSLRAFDVYNKMKKMMEDNPNCTPYKETFTMLLNIMLKKIKTRKELCYTSFGTVYNLMSDMKHLNVRPGERVMNALVKTYFNKCDQIYDAEDVCHTMRLLGWEPNANCLSYLIIAHCEKHRGKKGKCRLIGRTVRW